MPFDPRMIAIYALLAVAGLFALGGGVQTIRLAGVKAALAREQRDRQAETAMRERVAREYQAKIAAVQAENAKRQQEISDAWAKEREARAADLATATADLDSLRKQIDVFTAAGAFGAGVDPATCGALRTRAATLGGLLTEVVGAGGEMAREADRWAGAFRAAKRQLILDRNTCSSIGKQ